MGSAPSIVMNEAWDEIYLVGCFNYPHRQDGDFSIKLLKMEEGNLIAGINFNTVVEF